MATKSKKSTKAIKPPRAPRAQTPPRPGKPVFRAGTWIAVISFIAVLGAAYYLNRQAEEKAKAESTPSSEDTFVFEKDSAVASIEVESADGAATRVERNADKAWVLSKPEEAEADQGAAEAAATQIGSLRIITPVDNVSDPSIFGLDEPAYVITVEFEDGGKSVLEVGDKTPSDNGYYVRVDDDKVYVVALSGIDTLENLVSAPPYLNTPTPSPTATSTPLPTGTPDPAADTSSTPAATSTP